MSTHPHELAPLLLDLGRAGVEVSAHPDGAGRIRFRPPTIGPDLRDRLARHKPALLALLVPGGLGGLEADPEGGYTLGERLGIADELAMPTGPGSPAWLVAAGEGMTASRHRGENGAERSACITRNIRVG